MLKMGPNLPDKEMSCNPRRSFTNLLHFAGAERRIIVPRTLPNRAGQTPNSNFVSGAAVNVQDIAGEQVY
jgi:hypothetical protein